MMQLKMYLSAVHRKSRLAAVKLDVSCFRTVSNAKCSNPFAFYMLFTCILPECSNCKFSFAKEMVKKRIMLYYNFICDLLRVFFLLTLLIGLNLFEFRWIYLFIA